MDRHEVFRLDQVQHQLLLFLRRMSGGMERRERGVDDNVGADSCQLIDDSADADTIARNRVGAEQDRIAWNDVSGEFTTTLAPTLVSWLTTAETLVPLPGIGLLENSTVSPGIILMKR